MTTEREEKAVEFEMARAEALHDAAIAFEKLDNNNDGTIDYDEALALIRAASDSRDLDSSN